ncbi:MAG: DNA polymerase III subunit alpha [Burkholderiaceae bacterium]|nr:DNA polymerase III subunit alpha [Burkholderiaceae bacterium]
MLPPQFVHLRMHSEYSISDGIVRLEAAVAKAAADQQPALAITDLGNTFAYIKFYKSARAAGVKPLLGADVWITNDSDRDRPYRLLLLVQNNQGYRNLCELLSRAWLKNAYRDRGELRSEWFLEASTVNDAKGTDKGRSKAKASATLGDGLIALSGAMAGEIADALAKSKTPAQAEGPADAVLKKYLAAFGDRFYLEIQRAGLPGEETYIRRVLSLALRHQVPVVATHPVQFLNAEDFRSHEARVCIAEGETLASGRRQRRFTAQQYLTQQAEMAEKFSDIPQALANTLEIAQRCSVSLQLGKAQLPDFPTPNGETLEDYLRITAREGLEIRLAERYVSEEVRARHAGHYRERLEMEIQTIIEMGFPGYFLIVADFINWAKRNGVPVGPGRGSGAGSLVAYSLGITDLDPIPYALLFERFLNPERVSMPDFDIDFCQDNRYKVIDYVRSKYGKDAVSQIVTFGTMASKAVIRDAGRVLNLPYNFCDQLSKLIPVVQNKPLSLEAAKKEEPILAERAEKEDEVRELLALASPLEDLTRNIGMHAGGVLIAPGRLTDFCPLYQAPGSEGDEGIVSMYDKDDVEAAGLVKFDFLGLRNLTIIQMAVDYINGLHPGRALTLRELDGFDDPAAYQVLRDANTTAIFQVESDGMKKLLAKLQPDRFEDIIAVLALYRPGPLNSGMVDDFIKRKRGEQQIDYFHDSLKDCLSPTYGVIVYQEQVMQIAQIIAGYSLGGADLLRRAMGKKKPEEMAQQREIFVKGALEKGHSQALATRLFDLMEKFAEYGFNKSHTAAYAVLTYQTAWLKAHHTAEFMAATLSADMDDTDKVAFFLADARANGVRVLAPNINESNYRFDPVRLDAKPDADEEAEQRNIQIQYGLGAVRGVGENAVMNILTTRQQDGPFKDIFDFCRRIDRRIVNKRSIEALVKAGAFDRLHANRAQLLAGVSIAVGAADQAQASLHQGGLFEAADQTIQEIELPKTAPWNERERLLEEKQALGFCFSGHLFAPYAQEIRRFVSTPLNRLSVSRDAVWMSGVVSASRAQMTKRGMMRIVEIDDGTAKLELTVFSELWDQHRQSIKVDEPLIICARVEQDDYSGGLRGAAAEILTLGDARTKFSLGIRVRVAGDTVPEKLRSLLEPWRTPKQGCPIVLRMHRGDAECDIQLPEDWRVRPEEELLRTLGQHFAKESVEIMYR